MSGITRDLLSVIPTLRELKGVRSKGDDGAYLILKRPDCVVCNHQVSLVPNFR